MPPKPDPQFRADRTEAESVQTDVRQCGIDIRAIAAAGLEHQQQYRTICQWDVCMLTVTDRLPEGLLEIEPTRLYEILDGPTLIHLPGRQAPPLFVSVLLHGNETTGFFAIQRLLKHYGDRQLPRALSILIGNVRAARERARRLDSQPDYNRIWQGGDLPEHQMARQAIDEMARRSVFASIDIHNNTGRNPHYACITRLESPFLQLATLFGRTTVYFTQPKTVQANAFARLCPSMVVECGQPGHSYGTQHAFELVDACLHLSHFSQRPVHPSAIDLFHTVAIVKVPDNVQISFDSSSSADICFQSNLDLLNFAELPAATRLATYKPGREYSLHVTDEGQGEVSDRYFTYQNGEIRTKLAVTPSMLTLDPRIIRQDCLCYLMERYPLTCKIEPVA
ncbi:M14 family metallopeptidase [Synechococcus sp. PCC 7336]|uniref:M14 family metallopeptidase n=1 Tax=Synechococcus sp. PCC 7336 TaxID=195250 RepID=UPI000370DE78|nr:M14 family metallopeptidase [Synechococcus sp. PCC 7336]